MLECMSVDIVVDDVACGGGSGGNSDDDYYVQVVCSFRWQHSKDADAQYKSVSKCLNVSAWLFVWLLH